MEIPNLVKPYAIFESVTPIEEQEVFTLSLSKCFCLGSNQGHLSYKDSALTAELQKLLLTALTADPDLIGAELQKQLSVL